MLARRTDTPMDMLDREFNRMLGRLWSGNAEVPSTLAPYAVDVHEDPDHFFVTAELPGFDKDDVDITLEDGVLSIRAERKEETRTGGDALTRGHGNPVPCREAGAMRQMVAHCWPNTRVAAAIAVDRLLR